MMKKLLAICLAMMALVGLCLAEEPDIYTWDVWAYTLTEEGAVIAEYDRTEVSPEVLIIPDELDGHPVVGIAEGAFTVLMSEITFAGNLPHLINENGFLIDARTDTLLYTAPSSRGKELPAVRRLGKWSLINWAEWDMDVVITEGVEEIGSSAFYDIGLASLTLPESLRLIETNAFNAFGVEGGEIILPAGVKTVQFGAFGMHYVDADPTGRAYWHLTVTPTDKWGTHFETYFEYAARTGDDWDMENYTLALYETEETADGLVITDLDWAGYGDAVPEVITLPAEIQGDPVVGIGSNVFNTSEFDYEEIIQYITIPEGVQYLSDFALGCCHNAKVVFFPSTLEVIPEGCFHHFGGEIVLHADNPYFTNHQGFLVDVAKDTLLYAGPSANGFDIPAVRRLGTGSLQNYDAPDGNAVIPEGVVEIGEAALSGWYYRSLTLPESLRKIEYMGLYCMVDTPVTIPAGCTDIGEDALPMLNDDPWFD